MSKLVFAVFDSKAGVYLPPFMARTRGEAIRMFEDACKDEKSMLFAHPEDYTLFYIADYNEATAIYLPLEVKQSLCLASEVKAAKE